MSFHTVDRLGVCVCVGGGFMVGGGETGPTSLSNPWGPVAERGFPDGPVVRTLLFTEGLDSVPGQGIKTLQAKLEQPPPPKKPECWRHIGCCLCLNLDWLWLKKRRKV